MALDTDNLKQLADELESRAKVEREKLYKLIGRETAYMLLGGIIGAAVTWFFLV
jgi:hypothetical protein